MYCMKYCSRITWSVFKRLHKPSPQTQVRKNVDLNEFSTASSVFRLQKCQTPFGLELSDDPLRHDAMFMKRSLLTCGLSTSYNNIYVQKRCKSMKGHGRSGTEKQKAKKEARKSKQEDKDSDDEDEVEVQDDGEFTDLPDEDDPTLPLNYKHRKAYVKTIRADSLVSGGLGLSRNRTDEIFYSSLLRLNGEKLLKKSKKVAVGDYVDFILSKQEEIFKIQRVKLVKINAEKTWKDKFVLTLRIWKTPFEIKVEKKYYSPKNPKQDVS